MYVVTIILELHTYAYALEHVFILVLTFGEEQINQISFICFFL